MTPIPSYETAQSIIGSELQLHLQDTSFLATARPQLDANHLGLKKIKKRLIEYLAVVQLQELNTEREIAEEQKHAVSVALEQAGKVNAESEAKPVTPTEASGKAEQSNAAVPFDKHLAEATTAESNRLCYTTESEEAEYRRPYPPVSILSTIECHCILATKARWSSGHWKDFA